MGDSEFGGTTGPVSIEVLLEDIVVEVLDEFDAGEGVEIVRAEEWEASFDGSASLDEANDVGRAELTKWEATISGYGCEKLGRNAGEGDRIQDHGVVEVVSTHGCRITKGRVGRCGPAQAFEELSQQ